MFVIRIKNHNFNKHTFQRKPNHNPTAKSTMGKARGFLNVLNSVISPETQPTQPPPKPKEQVEREKAERLEKEANMTESEKKMSRIKNKIILPKEERRDWRSFDGKPGSARSRGAFGPGDGMRGPGGGSAGGGEGGDAGGDCGGDGGGE